VLNKRLITKVNYLLNAISGFSIYKKMRKFASVANRSVAILKRGKSGQHRAPCYL